MVEQFLLTFARAEKHLQSRVYSERLTYKLIVGVYIYGSPGSGKSYLMDLLYDTIPNTIKKKRVHFNSFMLDIHQRLHQFRLRYGKMKYNI